MFNLPLANEGGWVGSWRVLLISREHNGYQHAKLPGQNKLKMYKINGNWDYKIRYISINNPMNNLEVDTYQCYQIFSHFLPLAGL